MHDTQLFQSQGPSFRGRDVCDVWQQAEGLGVEFRPNKGVPFLRIATSESRAMPEWTGTNHADVHRLRCDANGRQDFDEGAHPDSVQAVRDEGSGQPAGASSLSLQALQRRWFELLARRADEREQAAAPGSALPRLATEGLHQRPVHVPRVRPDWWGVASASHQAVGTVSGAALHGEQRPHVVCAVSSTDRHIRSQNTCAFHG